MTERILLGHFLTRDQAARRARIPSEEVLRRPDLLHIGGTWLEEVYFEFQFDDYGIRPKLGDVVRALRTEYEDVAIADWLARRNDRLEGRTPLGWLATGGDVSRLSAAASKSGPVA